MNADVVSTAPLFTRSQGQGEIVVCLHSSTGSQAQWRALVHRGAERCQWVTPDLHGHGRSPAWPEGRPNTLQVDADGVTGLLRCADGGLLPRGVHLVGHSYGGALALQIALRHPRWVRSLTLYEPAAFGVIGAMAPGDAALGEIEDIAHSVAALVNAGDLDGAARIFVGYWGGAGAWDAMNAEQRAVVLLRIATVPRHFDALREARWNAATLHRLTMPILLIQGAHTRAPARRVADLLAEALPQLQRLSLAGAGHLGPVTHAGEVNAAIVAHLDIGAYGGVRASQIQPAAFV